MKAAVLYYPGPAENLTLEERPIPEPAEGQVLVRVKAFGLNRSELMTRKGLSPGVRLPRILGIECAGEVAFDPSGQYPAGQQVAALMGGMGRDFDGSYAKFTVLSKSLLLPIRSTLHLSANYLGDLLKQETGKTALDYIQAKLLALAKEKLFAPRKSVGEVAYELGFKYPQHFTRFFKQQVGQSPHQYRLLK